MTSAKSYATEARVNALVARIGAQPADVHITDFTGTGVKTVSASAQQIPSGSIKGGEIYDVAAGGSFSVGATPPTEVKFSLFYGTVSQRNVGDVHVADADLAGMANAANWGWSLRGTLCWLSASSCFADLVLTWHKAAGVTGTTAYLEVTTSASVDTSSARALTLAFTRTGGSMTLNTQYAHFAPRYGAWAG